MRMLPRFTLAALAVLAASSVAAAAGNVEKGRQVAATCLACHGPDGAGNAAGGFPRLAAIDASFMLKQLQDFKAGTRDNAIMKPFATALSDTEMRDVAAYYGSLKTIATAPTEAAPELLALGERFAKRGMWDRYIPPCETCHGPGSQGAGPAFPRLAGQHASYIESQFQAWRTGARHNDPVQVMLAVAERMTDAEIKAVAAYLAAQPAK